MESNQDQTYKPYLQLYIRTYQLHQVNSSCKESSEDPTSGKGVVSAVSKDVMQYLQLETVLYKQQPSKHYPQLDISGLMINVKKAMMIHIQGKN